MLSIDLSKNIENKDVCLYLREVIDYLCTLHNMYGRKEKESAGVSASSSSSSSSSNLSSEGNFDVPEHPVSIYDTLESLKDTEKIKDLSIMRQCLYTLSYLASADCTRRCLGENQRQITDAIKVLISILDIVLRVHCPREEKVNIVLEDEHTRITVYASNEDLRLSCKFSEFGGAYKCIHMLRMYTRKMIDHMECCNTFHVSDVARQCISEHFFISNNGIDCAPSREKPRIAQSTQDDMSAEFGDCIVLVSTYINRRLGYDAVHNNFVNMRSIMNKIIVFMKNSNMTTRVLGADSLASIMSMSCYNCPTSAKSSNNIEQARDVCSVANDIIDRVKHLDEDEFEEHTSDFDVLTGYTVTLKLRTDFEVQNPDCEEKSLSRLHAETSEHFPNRELNAVDSMHRVFFDYMLGRVTSLRPEVNGERLTNSKRQRNQIETSVPVVPTSNRKDMRDYQLFTEWCDVLVEDYMLRAFTTDLNGSKRKQYFKTIRTYIMRWLYKKYGQKFIMESDIRNRFGGTHPIVSFKFNNSGAPISTFKRYVVRGMSVALSRGVRDSQENEMLMSKMLVCIRTTHKNIECHDESVLLVPLPDIDEEDPQFNSVFFRAALRPTTSNAASSNNSSTSASEHIFMDDDDQRTRTSPPSRDKRQCTISSRQNLVDLRVGVTPERSSTMDDILKDVYDDDDSKVPGDMCSMIACPEIDVQNFERSMNKPTHAQIDKHMARIDMTGYVYTNSEINCFNEFVARKILEISRRDDVHTELAREVHNDCFALMRTSLRELEAKQSHCIVTLRDTGNIMTEMYRQQKMVVFRSNYNILLTFYTHTPLFVRILNKDDGGKDLVDIFYWCSANGDLVDSCKSLGALLPPIDKTTMGEDEVSTAYTNVRSWLNRVNRYNTEEKDAAGDNVYVNEHRSIEKCNSANRCSRITVITCDGDASNPQSHGAKIHFCHEHMKHCALCGKLGCTSMCVRYGLYRQKCYGCSIKTL